ncbi:hypothetical protein [Kribbella sp. NPDC048915]|uniref:hypothetical protein n=1 Tax=Kribbella sp. NPDC048915 TaxID=3155148 RepID=UPI0033C3B732
MRRTLRARRDRTPPATDAVQYCAFCATEMPFERVAPVDHLADDADEWICIKCGYALLVDPPTQQLHHTG